MPHRALLDLLTHHVHILEMNGESYRLKRSRESASSRLQKNRTPLSLPLHCPLSLPNGRHSTCHAAHGHRARWYTIPTPEDSPVGGADRGRYFSMMLIISIPDDDGVYGFTNLKTRFWAPTQHRADGRLGARFRGFCA